MTDSRPEDANAMTTAEKAVAKQVRLTRTSMVLERITRSFWPLWTVGVLLVAASAFGALDMFGPNAVSVVLAVVAVVLAGLLVVGIRAYRHPSREDAVTRLDADLPGRPLSTLKDTLASGQSDPATQRVWTVHLTRMAEAARKAEARAPDLRLSDRDPWALRLAALVALVAAALFSRGPTLEAPLPGLTVAEAVTAGPSFEAWISPPDYTGQPTLYLGDLTDEARLSVPQGSDITLRVYGDAEFAIEQTVTPEEASLAERAVGIRDSAFTAEESGRLAFLDRGEIVGDWQLDVGTDTPPQVNLAGGIARAMSGAAEITFEAQDDYGVLGVTAVIALDLAAVDRRYGLQTAPDGFEELVIDLPMPLNGEDREIFETLTEDFSDHPLASLPVRITLEAVDAAGQMTTTVPEAAILPQRFFYDPVAKTIVEQRRDFLWSLDNGTRVSQILRAITHLPDDLDVKPGPFLALRHVIRSFDEARRDDRLAEEQEALAEELWRVALLIEDGNLADAEERLRRAQDRLAEALRNDASDEEIAQLMDELREAMQDFMQQMAQEMLNDPDSQQQMADMQNQQQMSPTDLQELLDQIQELSENGQREQAQALLDQLRQMMENMQMALQQGGGEGQGNPTQDELQEMLREQQDLADRS
ncbi:MAG: DUF4175 family protein, partial [Pseudomonadota bacterium]